MIGSVALVTAFAMIVCPLTMLADTPRSTGSGIEGVIFVSPIHPGPTRIDQPDSAPAGNVMFTVKRKDEKVASFTTDPVGHFSVALPPGHYTVLREGAARIGRWSFEADVTAGKVTNVQWTGDSGMR